MINVKQFVFGLMLLTIAVTVYFLKEHFRKLQSHEGTCK